MSLQSVLREIVPPFLLPVFRRLRRLTNGSRPEWEYVSDHWVGQHAAGWSAATVAATQEARWPEFVRMAQGSGPLGIPYEGRQLSQPDRNAHNVVMSYGYVLARAARARTKLSVLDWGGGIGHYHVLSRTLLPDVAFEYYCRDLPSLCEVGRRMQPEVVFLDREEDCFTRTYDLVLASGSTQYSPDWKETLGQLARAAEPFLYLARLPIVHRVPSFVAVQRPARHGYETEYRGWILNRAELLDTMNSQGAELLREFLGEPGPPVHGAPERGEHRAFLFRTRRMG